MESSENKYGIETQTWNMCEQINALATTIPWYFDQNNFLSQKNYWTQKNLPAEYKDIKNVFDVINRKIWEKSFWFLETSDWYKLTYWNIIFPYTCESPRQLLSLLTLTNYTTNYLTTNWDLIHWRWILANSSSWYFLHWREYNSSKTLMPYDFLTAVFTKDEKIAWPSNPTSSTPIVSKKLEDWYYQEFQKFITKIVETKKP